MRTNGASEVGDLWLVVLVSGAAAVASLVGGLVGGWRRPSSLVSSIALGLAGGALLGTITFEMLPRADELAGVALAAGAFLVGVALMYAFDLFVQRGKLAGPAADQREQIEQFHREHPAAGDEVTVLAGGTALEEVVEGVSIGVGAAIQPGLAVFVAASIALDNITEGMSIGALSSERADSTRAGRRRAARWTGTIGASLFVSAVAAWLLLRSLPDPVLGVLLGSGGGGMLYLTITDLLPEAEQRHYQHSSAIAAALGFVAAFSASRLV